MLRNPGGLIGLVILAIAIAGRGVRPAAVSELALAHGAAAVPAAVHACRPCRSAPTRSAATCLPASSTAPASRCWSASSRRWWRSPSAFPSAPSAGYFGGRIDDALMRFTEFFQTIPSFALAIVLVAILQPSIVFDRRRDRHRELAAGGAAGARRGAVAAHPRICPGRHRHRAEPSAGSSGARSCPTRCRR